jgi:hypothetical protein
LARLEVGGAAEIVVSSRDPRKVPILLKKSELAPIGLRWFWFVDFGQCSLTTFATAFGGFGWF